MEMFLRDFTYHCRTRSNRIRKEVSPDESDSQDLRYFMPTRLTR